MENTMSKPPRMPVMSTMNARLRLFSCVRAL